MFGALSALLLSCGPVDVPGEAPVCSDAADCAGGELCTFGFCHAGAPNPIELSVRFSPTPDTGLLEQQVPDLDLAVGPAFAVTLLEPAVLTGVVRYADNPLVSNVPGQIEAVTPGDVEGFPYRFTAESVEGLTASGKGYELRILPGRDYAVTFRPADPGVPPFTTTLPAAQAQTGDWTIQLPAKSDYAELNAIVRLGPIEPVAGAPVVVLLPGGGALPARTTQPNGHLVTLLPPGTEEVRLLVSAPAEGPLFPDFTSEPIPVPGRDPAHPEEPAPSVAISVPEPSAEAFVASLRVIGPDGVAVPGQPLTLRGTLDQGTLLRSATTGDDGVATFQALPGSWEALVSIPPSGVLASRVFPIDLDATGTTTDLALSARLELSGVVLDRSGEPIAGGTVHAHLRPAPPASPYGLSLSAAAFKGPIEDGAFSIGVDPGTYDLRIVPDLATGAPATLRLDVALEDDASIAIELPPPDLVHMTVAGPDSSLLAGVTVELFLRGGDGAPRLLAKGLTGEDGFVDLLVPHLSEPGSP